MQLASFNVGKRLIQSNAKKLLDNQTGKKIINRKTQRYYEEQLEDLGLNVNKTLAWYKRSLKNNEFDRNRSNIQNFYKEDIQNAANRFTKEVILNPSTAEANRPLWFSNPSVNFLVQFAGYPTVFNNTIMKRFVNETKNYPTKVAPKILATSMLMTSVALLGNYIRTVGVSGNQERWDNQTDGEKIFEAFRRWGGLAFFDYAQRAESEKERGAGLPTAAIKGVVGPVGQDIVDMIAYRKGFTGVAVDNLPYSAWLPADVKKKMKAGAREIDKAIDDNTLNLFPDEPEQSKKSKSTRRTPYRKGLEVNIPNAVREPEKAKIRNMNMTYAELGGILAQDPEDRKGFAEGEEVKYGRASNWLWNALLHGSPYGQMKMWSKILGEADLKKRPRINTVKSKLDEAVSWMDDSFVDPVKEVTSTEWGKKREEARRQEALDQSNVPINDTDEDEASGWFGIGRKGRQARRAQRRAERRGERDLETYAEKLAREARDAQRGAEQTQRIQSQSRHRGDAMFKREVEALTGTDSGTEGSRGTRRVMFNEGSLVNVLENLQTAFDTLSAREKIEVAGLLNQKRKSFADGGGIKLFGEDGLIFDHTNPLDYLMAIPGLGLLGVGAKAASKFKVADKLRMASRQQKLPKTQYHGGYSSVEKGQATSSGFYTTPQFSYADAFARPKYRTITERGTPGLYKLDLSKAKNIELTDKPTKGLQKSIDAELEKLTKKGTRQHALDKQFGLKGTFSSRNLPEKDRRLYEGLDHLFGKGRTISGGAPTYRMEETLDFLRKQGVEILTDSKVLKAGAKGKSKEAEYFLIKDFPKKKLTEEEIKKLRELLMKKGSYAEGGEVLSNEQLQFINLALDVHQKQED